MSKNHENHHHDEEVPRCCYGKSRSRVVGGGAKQDRWGQNHRPHLYLHHRQGQLHCVSRRCQASEKATLAAALYIETLSGNMYWVFRQKQVGKKEIHIVHLNKYELEKGKYILSI